MNDADMKDYKFWTTGKDDLWVMELYCTVPSCKVRNLETGEIKEFGLGGVTAGEFSPVEMDRALESKLFTILR